MSEEELSTELQDPKAHGLESCWYEITYIVVRTES